MQHFDDFAQMQRDAERRVMEMQRRAMAAVDSVKYPDFLSRREVPNESIPKVEEPVPPVTDDTPPQKKLEDAPANKPDISLSEKLGISDDDSESMMLIIVILLLLREDADERLIFALLYILL